MGGVGDLPLLNFCLGKWWVKPFLRKCFIIKRGTTFESIVYFFVNIKTFIIKRKLSRIIKTDFLLCLRFVNTNDLVMEKEKYLKVKQFQRLSKIYAVHRAEWVGSQFRLSRGGCKS